MAFQGQIEKLVDRLADLTQRDKVAWEQTGDERIFLASVSKFIVTIGEIPPYGAPDYEFTIRGSEGRVIEQVTATQGQDWTRLRDLYNMARRKALHVDEALSDLLSSLERI